MLLQLYEVISAYFTSDFNGWLTEVYGSDVQETLNRWEKFFWNLSSILYLSNLPVKRSKIKIVQVKNKQFKVSMIIV